MTSLSVVIVGTRLNLRWTNKIVAADDYMTPLALRPPQNIVTYLKVNYAGRPIYQFGISFFGIALLIGYLRLLQGTSNKAYRGAIWCTVAFVSVGHVGSAMSLLFACQPIEKSWKPGRPGTCLPVDASFTVYSILTIVSDVIVAVLVCAFMLGLFTTLCSVFRCAQIKRIQSVRRRKLDYAGLCGA
ncbi:hypothetical protein MY1884_003986 [Beauveria asiatica]|uniref:Rhodopsin domain-containing protein n=1 Tax=Beauveria bassiana TaxID=176275 RepID=A0A2N6NCY1_BEABA|nr:hypothetical protein BM221_008487 [Beauveria bassiana]